MPGQKWDLFGFMNALREWMRRDPPPGELLARVAEFGAVLERDPETDADSEGAPGFLLRRIPGTEHDERIVAITFTISQAKPKGPGEVHCQDVTCIEYPRETLFGVWPPVPHHQR